jgi:alpha-glucosidase
MARASSEWWRGSVTYHIYPRSFQDSGTDGIGDLPGITSRLDHVASLGVDAIWLSPFFTSPMADMGYDVSNYTDVDPLFGTLADFDRLLERAHALGLKVIIDQVLSHTSDRHPWFEESRRSRDNPKADWFVWADPKADGAPPNNWPSVFGGSAWQWEARRRQYYLHNFLVEQPDLNFWEPAVQDALEDVMRFWLDRGVDGFRFDTVNFYYHDRKLRPNPPAARVDPHPTVNPYDMQAHVRSKTQPQNIGFLKRIRRLMDGYEGRTTVGEIGETDRSVEIMAEYTRGTDRLHMAYSFEMLGTHFSSAFFRSATERFFGTARDGWPCWSFSNHDVIRHVTRWKEHARDPDSLARQTAALLLSLRGSVCIYQGEELGLEETELELSELTDPPGIRFWPEYKGRDGCRTPIPWNSGNDHSGFSTATPWLPIKPRQAARDVASQEADGGSVLAFYRGMLAFRRSSPSLRGGSIRFLDTAEPVLAYLREDAGEGIVCIFNLSPERVSVTVAGVAADAGAPSQAAELVGRTLTLGPNGFAFLGCAGPSRDVEVAFDG